METLHQMLQWNVAWYEHLLRQVPVVEKREDFLEAVKVNGVFRYYRHFRDETGAWHRVYLRKDQMDLATKMAQDEYYEKFRKTGESSLKDMLKLLAHYSEEELQDVYAQMPEGKRILVQPLLLPMEQWLEETKGGSAAYPENRVHDTASGVKVRSKSEAILSDIYNMDEVPHVYEPAVRLKDGTVFHPDYGFYNPETQQMVYWEHFGKMDDPVYMQRAFEKLEKYAENGIILGKNLHVSFETKTFRSSREWVEGIINQQLQPLKHYFKKREQRVRKKRRGRKPRK